MIDATTRRIAIVALTLAAAALPVAAPNTAMAQARPARADTMRLGVLHDAAMRHDPRDRQVELLAAQAGLRLRSLDAELLPAFGINAGAQYQSDVASLPIRLPGEGTVPGPAHDSYDAHVAARQRLYDPTRGARRDLERARLAEGRARVRSAQYALRQAVNEAYFSALHASSQRAELEAAMAALEARLEIARDRVRLGSALPSESAIIEAELLRRRQSLDGLAAARDAALAVLGELTGRAVDSGAVLALPRLGDEVARARAAADGIRARPEYAHFARSRDVLELQREVVAARDAPRVSAIGRLGYGRPGLDPLGRELDAYWLAGVQLEWSPWSWGAARREREELAVQQEIVGTEEAAFTESVRRGVVAELANMDRLERTLATDERIVALTEEVLRETRLRYAEAVVTAAELVDRESDVLAARLARATHRVELERARAALLTILGLEIPS